MFFILNAYVSVWVRFSSWIDFSPDLTMLKNLLYSIRHLICLLSHGLEKILIKPGQIIKPAKCHKISRYPSVVKSLWHCNLFFVNNKQISNYSSYLYLLFSFFIVSIALFIIQKTLFLSCFFLYINVFINTIFQDLIIIV